MKFDLVITIVNRGYSDLVMEAARSKGATGGTIVTAKGTADHVEKFFNLSLQPEKELVMIVVKHDDRHAIMEEITVKAGLKTAGQGITFALPVEDAIGLRE